MVDTENSGNGSSVAGVCSSGRAVAGERGIGVRGDRGGVKVEREGVRGASRSPKEDEATRRAECGGE